MKWQLIGTVVLCAVISILSSLLYVTETPAAALTQKQQQECEKRADKCSTARAMENIAAMEHRIIGNDGLYKWYWQQSKAKCKPNQDPNMGLHTNKCR